MCVHVCMCMCVCAHTQMLSCMCGMWSQFSPTSQGFLGTELRDSSLYGKHHYPLRHLANLLVLFLIKVDSNFQSLEFEKNSQMYLGSSEAELEPQI